MLDRFDGDARGFAVDVEVTASAGPQGLTAVEAASRLSSQGPNSVPTAPAHRVRSLLAKLMGPVS